MGSNRGGAAGGKESRDEDVVSGTHSVPRRFRIYDGDRLIVEASGNAEQVKTFASNLFVIPAGEPDMGEPENDATVPHQVIDLKRMKPTALHLLYGNVLMHLFVGAEGRVTKAEVVDADNNDLIRDTKHFCRSLKFAPQMRKGAPVPFEQYMYIQHSLNFGDPVQPDSSSTRSPSSAPR
ncbi:MAG TPA: energy transducer TonB [Acidobacteriaceae bacterium]|jgi:hypothetical protein|nr:energy transducer TonB [Acidobacteriaceae bacterium]